LAWRQHDGGHTGTPSMKWFVPWTDLKIGHAPPWKIAGGPSPGGR